MILNILTIPDSVTGDSVFHKSIRYDKREEKTEKLQGYLRVLEIFCTRSRDTLQKPHKNPELQLAESLKEYGTFVTSCCFAIHFIEQH
jgi:hypothetical protein